MVAIAQSLGFNLNIVECKLIRIIIIKITN